MRRVPSNPAAWNATRPRQSAPRTARSFLIFALASVGTFLMAARAVNWFGGPLWLVLVFLGTGLALAGYYLARLLHGSKVARRFTARRRR